ncbi:MAG: recombinase family protein [Planctomycetota bacterium]
MSLDAQRAKCEAYASLYDLELVAVVADPGASGKTLERDGLRQVLAMIRTGEAEAVLVAKLDRLTRNVADLGGLLVDYFGEKGAALLSVGEQIDTRSAAGRLVLNVLTSVAQWEREAIGERTATALRHKRQRGERTGGSLPFGFRLAADGRMLEADPAEAATVARIHALRAEGMTQQKIADTLTDDDTPCRGSKWHRTTIARILSDDHHATDLTTPTVRLVAG